MESIPHGNLCVALRTTTKTTTNKTKTATNECSGIMGKPSCSAVQLGRKDKPWTVWPEPLLSISTCFITKYFLPELELWGILKPCCKKGRHLGT
jgi:hypothetical protein